MAVVEDFIEEEPATGPPVGVSDEGHEEGIRDRTSANTDSRTKLKSKAKSKAKAKATAKAKARAGTQSTDQAPRTGDLGGKAHLGIPLTHPSVVRSTNTAPLISLDDVDIENDEETYGQDDEDVGIEYAVNEDEDEYEDEDEEMEYELGMNMDIPGLPDMANSRLFTLKPGEEVPENFLRQRQRQRDPPSSSSRDASRRRGAGSPSATVRRTANSAGPRGAVVGEGQDADEDEIFNTLILVVPFTFLYLLLDILVHLQYSHRPTWDLLGKHLMTAAPTLYMITLYTNRHPKHFATISLLMSASILAGCRLIWLVNKASWSVVTAQAPPMGTLWILTIVQLPLSRALIALVAVGGWLKYSGLELIP